MPEVDEKRLKRGTYTLEADFFNGFKTSVRNGQTLLAMEYLLEVITDLQTELDELKLRQSAEKSKATPAPAKKTTVESSSE